MPLQMSCRKRTLMKLKISNHAQIRLRQRGIPMQVVTVLMEYGILRRVPGATKYYLDKRAIDERIHELKREIEQVERLKNVSLIVADDDGSIITVQRASKGLG